MKLGTEKKWQVYALAGLAVIAGYLVYSNLFSGPSSPAPARRADPTATSIMDSVPPPDIARGEQKTGRPGATKAKNKDFRPALHSKNPAEQIDTSSVDPTLRLDLLAQVQQVPQAGGERDLFQILKAPPVKEAPKGPEPKVAPIYGPPTPPPPPPAPVDPKSLPPTPIPLKYYGFYTERVSGRKTAYFLDNDEIIQATEGMTVKGHYRVVQIKLTEVVMEDTVDKRQQTLKREQEVTSG